MNKNEFRVTYDGYWYRIQRYTRVWWKMWLGKAWARVVLTQDGVEYDVPGYDNLKFISLEQAEGYTKRILLDEAMYNAVEKPL